jgi:hypothetical protein
MENLINQEEHMQDTYHSSEDIDICPHLVEWEQSVILICRAWSSTYVPDGAGIISINNVIFTSMKT